MIANEIFCLGLCNAYENETAVHGYHCACTTIRWYLWYRVLCRGIVLIKDCNEKFFIWLGIQSLPFSIKNTANQKGRNPLNFLRYAIGRIHTHALTKIAYVLGHALVPVKINTCLFSFQKGKLLIYTFTHIGGIDAIHIFLFITSENNQPPSPQKSNDRLNRREKVDTTPSGLCVRHFVFFCRRRLAAE